MATLFKKNAFSWLYVCYCLVFSYSVQAQVNYEANQNNLTDVIQDINDDLGGIMEVSVAHLTTFLTPYIATHSTPNFRGPNVSIDNYDATSIHFSWPASNTAIHRLGYLNLRNGASENLIANQPNGSFDIPDDLYLFAFKVYDPDGPGISSISIIIYDKVIALQADPNLGCDCSYKYSEALAEGGNNFPEEDEFDLYINTGGPFSQALYKVHFIKACSTCEEYIYNSTCLSFPNPEQGDSPPFLILAADIPIAAVSFEGTGLIYFEVEPGYELRIGACKSTTKGRDDSSTQIRSSATLQVKLQQDQLRVSGDVQTDQQYFLSIYSMSGQLLERKEQVAQQTEISESFNFSIYPAGMYLLRLEGAGISQVRRFIK